MSEAEMKILLERIILAEARIAELEADVRQHEKDIVILQRRIIEKG
jgi:hypothetical protein